MYCRHCGNQLDTKDKKCPACNKSVRSFSTALHWIISIVMFFSCLSLIGILYIKMGDLRKALDSQQLLASKIESSKDINETVEKVVSKPEEEKVVSEPAEMPAKEKKTVSKTESALPTAQKEAEKIIYKQVEVPIKEKKTAPKEESTILKIEKEKITYKQIEVPIEERKDTTALIKSAQEKVFTIFTNAGQGSGFLINNNGDVLTNAHVVEGSTSVEVKGKDGKRYSGTVIGYSNNSDVAVIRAPDLAGQEPLELESTSPAEIGAEVMTLGSPQGYENTVTLGNISGIGRTFVIDQFEYEEVYQISAPIAPGSSGGPLVDKSTGKVIAINSAVDTRDANIGFSIPLYKIYDLISSWISNPMSEKEIASYFYNDDGDFIYQNLFSNHGYFDRGSYKDEYHEYAEVPKEWYDNLEEDTNTAQE
ncbi:peptidase S1 and S6 chymotrypsin/Hap [Niallia circulans]|uniref:S1C family serine protease n=1 Tax=Niallia circulans TaxID=1397 RepID=UPI00077C4E59|nr:S1C family serine protease [Niallia circulans]MED3841048.1 trypsin-like peptidase domain-containing protein [Niallia circulans]MED4245411.1 trypsin-like peptidase domain-containing protein [Niallia circulans]MED4249340.1 trypsin-like peptidase domain-containing protein [Niallia circulans]SPT84554.1 peptidase S1 and S6 chymotrypsin/Hap [Niallia circulans]